MVSGYFKRNICYFNMKRVEHVQHVHFYIKGTRSGLGHFTLIWPWKFFPFSRHLNFCPDFLFMQKNSLIRKIRLISKSMTSQAGKQTIAMHILANVLRSKGNQTLKFGQLIEYNMRNIFLENLYAKCNRETILRPARKKVKIEHISGSMWWSKVLYSLFLLHVKLKAIKIYWN